MAGEWNTWLAALRVAEKGPVVVGDGDGFPAATRGLAWETPVEIEGDWTGATLEGSISASPDAVSTLATFTITGPVVADGYSTFTASLPASTFNALAADTDIDGVTELPMMFRLTPDGLDEDTLFGGIFTVLGKV